jgi:perosamine synthetase
VISFGGSKLLSSGRGGAIFTKRAAFAQRAKIFCERGNNAFPLSELQAAVLIPQLARLDERNTARNQSVAQLAQKLADLPGLRMLDNGSLACQPGYYKVGFQFDAAAFPDISREDFTRALRAEGVAMDAGFRSFALRSTQRCRVAGPLDQSRRAGDAMCVLHHPVLLQPPSVVDAVACAMQRIMAWANSGRALR